MSANHKNMIVNEVIEKPSKGLLDFIRKTNEEREKTIQKMLKLLNSEKKPIHEYYKDWCKETKRNGGVLIGSSIKEFFDWYENKISETQSTELA